MKPGTPVELAGSSNVDAQSCIMRSICIESRKLLSLQTMRGTALILVPCAFLVEDHKNAPSTLPSKVVSDDRFKDTLGGVQRGPGCETTGKEFACGGSLKSDRGYQPMVVRWSLGTDIIHVLVAFYPSPPHQTAPCSANGFSAIFPSY